MATTSLTALKKILRKVRKKRAYLSLLAAIALPALDAEASSVTLHVGPASVGTGGSNPISIPPVNPIEYEFVYVTQNDWETNVGITPGLLFGKRSETAGGSYVSFGGGYVQSYNGGGPGLYSALGIDLGKTWCFNAEIKQAIGFSFGDERLVSPYAIRIGVTYAW